MEIPLAHTSYWLVAVLTENLIPKIFRATGPPGLVQRGTMEGCEESNTRTDKCHILVTVVELGI